MKKMIMKIDEYGYVSLSELESIPMMERDLYFHDKKIVDIINEGEY